MASSSPEDSPQIKSADHWLFGWDSTPGIVSVWADRSGRALVWQRDETGVRCSEQRFRPFLFAASLTDVAHLGEALAAEDTQGASQAAICYRELEGADERGYRYLLSAVSYATIERAISEGAGNRRGRKVGRISELDDYFTLGPVEQYLMQTGRVYFRGLAYTDIHRLQFDLETTALDPSKGRIFMVAVRDSRGFETVLEAPTAADEAALITNLCALIRERDPDVIENHNLFGFDLPFLSARANALAIPLRLGRSGGPPMLESYREPSAYRRRDRIRYSIAGREMIDTLDAVLRHDFSVRDMPGYGLKAVARYFGVAPAERTYIPGHAIYHTYEQDPAMVRRYALDDVREVDALSGVLMGAAFALAGMAPRPYQRAASAGPAMGILEPMLVRAYLHAGYALPRSESQDEAAGRHSGGAAYLFAGGVARHVVKADIASMYPSIMRVYKVGPSCDRLGVLLGLVERLTDLRLSHKQAARAASPASAEANQHQAVQAAMKILINSAYGYMGAGRMALFADRAAADKVTSTGRAILDQVVARLRERGMVLLEADTDGVFFAVPLAWSEQAERDLVDEVATQLPAGIRLEYEGRYAAMLSHEVKNYALLTYDDNLILRGGAMRSSRSERFGVRFLEAAVGCLLRGDVAGIAAAYQDTVSALVQRRLPVADVSTISRLTKSADEYLRSKGRMSEAAYEALLGAGRQQWEAGERVRFYRAEGGRFVWLPDKSEEPEVGDKVELEEQADAAAVAGQPGYDIQHYIRVLHTSYVSRLRKAFREADFAQLFRPQMQLGLFDQSLEQITPLWIELAKH